MLSNAEEKKLIDQLKVIFNQFVNADRTDMLLAVAQLSVHALYAVQSLAQSDLDDVDQASCAPVAAVSQLNTRQEVRCPNCRHVF